MRLGVGGLIGAAMSRPVTRTLGIGATILQCLVLWALGHGGLAFVSQATAVPILAGVLLRPLRAINPIAGANVSTVRQTVTPHGLLGGVMAVVNVGVMATMTVGAFVDDMLADNLTSDSAQRSCSEVCCRGIDKLRRREA